MSVPKVKCPSCGTEWTGPVVFCGECGAPITAHPSAGPGDRIARVPPAPPGGAIAVTRAGARPIAPTKPAADPKPADARVSRPMDLDRRGTVVGMPVVPQPAPDAGKARAHAGGKKGRKSSANIVVEPAGHDEADKMLEALDAGFDSISGPRSAPAAPPVEPAAAPSAPPEAPRGSDTPEVSITPSVVPDLPITEVSPEKAAAPPLDEAARRAQHESDMAEVRALFTEMAVAHARPLRDFMIEVSWGDPTREWLDVAVPASAALRRAADALEMPELGAALDGFSAALELVAAESTIHRDAKDLLLGAYTKLIELLPAAFSLEGERGRREPIIVRSLLLQVPGVQKVALDRLYAAGLVSLEMIYAAGPKEMAETTGLDLALCAGIHERFQRYRREIAAIDPGKDRAAERATLASLVASLERAHAEHEALASRWSPDAAAARAKARKERGDIVLEINVLLAHLGEVERLRALEKAPFAQKIRDLKAYLDEAKRRAPRA